MVSRLVCTASTLNNSGASTMVAEMSGVPPLVRLLRDGSPTSALHASAHHGAVSSLPHRCDCYGTALRRASSRRHAPSQRCADDL